MPQSALRPITSDCAQLVVGDEGDGDGTDEVVPLGLGVLSGGLGKFARERVGKGFEAIEVVGREVDADVVRRYRNTVDAHRALGVEHAGQAAADLDGLEPATERLAERALHQPLQPSLETLHAHRVRF